MVKISKHVIERTLCLLEKVAERGSSISYSQLASQIGLDLRNSTDREILESILCEINRRLHREGHPMLSAVVWNRRNNMPGNGFWECAHQLGKFYYPCSKRDFWIKEVKKVWKYYREKKEREKIRQRIERGEELRVEELAKLIGIDNKTLLDCLDQIGIFVKDENTILRGNEIKKAYEACRK